MLRRKNKQRDIRKGKILGGLFVVLFKEREVSRDLMDKVTFKQRLEGRKPCGLQEEEHSGQRKQYVQRSWGRSVFDGYQAQWRV